MMVEGCLSGFFCLFPSALDCVHMWCVRKMKHYPTFHPCQVCMRVYTINILYLPLPQHKMLHFCKISSNLFPVHNFQVRQYIYFKQIHIFADLYLMVYLMNWEFDTMIKIICFWMRSWQNTPLCKHTGK